MADDDDKPYKPGDAKKLLKKQLREQARNAAQKSREAARRQAAADTRGENSGVYCSACKNEGKRNGCGLCGACK